MPEKSAVIVRMGDLSGILILMKLAVFLTVL
jgi:hypothetical protein